jgi:hypothetical protein
MCLQELQIAALLLLKQLTDFHCLFACAGGFKMDKESSHKLIAPLHKKHLKRTENLHQPKRHWQLLHLPQPKHQR